MDKIEGFISSKIIKGNYIILDTFAKLGEDYSNATGYDIPKLYLKCMPLFNDVYSYFMTIDSTFIKRTKQEDICLSLFYNPFFNEICSKIKEDIENISIDKMKSLKRSLFSKLTEVSQYNILMHYNSPARDYFIEYDVFNKSNEILKLINQFL